MFDLRSNLAQVGAKLRVGWSKRRNGAIWFKEHWRGVSELVLLAVTTMATVASCNVSRQAANISADSLRISQQSNETAANALTASSLPFLSFEYDPAEKSILLVNRGTGPAIIWYAELISGDYKHLFLSTNYEISRASSKIPINDVVKDLTAGTLPVINSLADTPYIVGFSPNRPISQGEKLVLVDIGETDKGMIWNLQRKLGSDWTDENWGTVVEAKLDKEAFDLYHKISLKVCYTNILFNTNMLGLFGPPVLFDDIDCSEGPLSPPPVGREALGGRGA